MVNCTALEQGLKEVAGVERKRWRRWQVLLIMMRVQPHRPE